MKIKPLNLNCIQCGKPATRRATQDTKAFKHRDGSIIPSMIVTAPICEECHSKLDILFKF